MKQQIKNLIKKILDKNPVTRISISELKNEEWLKSDIEKQKVLEFEVNS